MQRIKNFWYDHKQQIKFFAVCLVIAFFTSFSPVTDAGDYDPYCDPEPLFGQNCSIPREFDGDVWSISATAFGLYIFGYIAREILDK